MAEWSAVVLAGGRGRRMGGPGGTDKAELTDGRVRLLDHVLAAVGEAAQVVVVGPSRPTAREVAWALEQPPRCGPLAAVGAGLALVEHLWVVVVAVDQPRLAAAVPALLQALTDHPDAPSSVLSDRDGRRQPLLSAHRAVALRAHLAALGELRDRPARLLLTADAVEVADDWGAADDLDTPAQAMLQGWSIPPVEEIAAVRPTLLEDREAGVIPMREDGV